MLIIFHAVHLRSLAFLSVGSILMYALAYLSLHRRKNRLAVGLMWTEVIVHAGFGVLVAGVDSAAQYYFLLFFPILFLGAPPRKACLPALCVLAIYVGLDARVHAVGPIEHLSPNNLAIVRYFNLTVFVGMLSYLAAFYRKRVVSSEKQLRTWANCDPLTGLANRRYMDSVIAEQDLDGQSPPMAVIMADIDHFKTINDRYGHEGGDLVLRKVAHAISSCVRQNDYVARWGGEEFLILLPGGAVDNMADTAERIRALVAATCFEELKLGGASPSVTLTLGTMQRLGGEPLHETIKRADERLYEGKRRGRNRVC
ncbi:MAG: GGDEF domain-containing protein [Pseudomonadota bacterium]